MLIMQLSEILSVNLQRIRRELGWSQEELAHRCGIERGVRNPTIKVLARIAKPLNADAFVLLAPPSPSSKKPN